jgi:hypothetical protein
VWSDHICDASEMYGPRIGGVLWEVEILRCVNGALERSSWEQDSLDKQLEGG